MVKKETGLSFSEYVMNYRITLAKMLLQATERNIQEIAGMTGFNSASYFSKIFKQETGISPAVFRARSSE
ncbi:MAG: helix-turn-helix domain-containing protein [Ruminococcus sp.]